MKAMTSARTAAIPDATWVESGKSRIVAQPDCAVAIVAVPKPVTIATTRAVGDAAVRHSVSMVMA